MRPEVHAMTEALAEEISETRRKQANRDVQVHGGRLIGMPEGRWVYRFLCSGELIAADGAPVRLILRQDGVDGELVGRNTGNVTVAVRRNLGPEIGEAQLRVDASYLLQELRERLLQLDSAPVGFDWGRALTLLEPASKTGIRELPTLPASYLIGLNEQQRNAVAVSRRADRCYVWGLPGTGKTTTLATIVGSFLADGLSVLLVSNTNLATDLALERTLDHFDQRRTTRADGEVLRVGVPALSSLAGRPGGPVLLDELLAARRSPLAQQKLRPPSARDALRQRRHTHVQEIEELDRLEALPHELARRIGEMERATCGQRIQRDNMRAKLIRMRDALQRAPQGRRNGTRVVRADVLKLERQLVTTEQNLDALLAQTQASRAEQQHALQEISERQPRSRIQVLTCSIDPLDVEIADLTAQIEEIDRRLKALKHEAIMGARLIATTAYKAFLDSVGDRTFDAVVIDEASMLPLPLSIHAAGLATERVVIAGDFRQLPPIVQADTSTAREWLARNAFETADVPEAVTREVPAVATIAVQHRMDPLISDLVSTAFYPERPLIVADEVLQRRTPDGVLAATGATELLLLDTASLAPRIARQGGMTSRYNLAHAQLVSALLHYLDDAGLFRGNDENMSERLGVIAPFRPQVRLLRNSVDGTVAPTHVDTVHRFQGGERDVIIFDSTDGTGIGVHRWYKETDLQAPGTRLLNVAVSRARHRLIWVGDMTRLAGAAAPDSPTKRLLDTVVARARHLTIHGLLTAHSGVAAVDVGDYLARLFDDIAAGTQSVELTSSKISPYLLKELEGAAEAAIRNGAEVRLTTEPPSDADVARALQRLARLGVTVDQRQPSQENTAIIDSRVLYTRSAPLLKRGQLGDLALRSTSASLAKAAATLAARRRNRTDPPIAEPHRTSICRTCGGVRTRVERWDPAMGGIRAWDACRHEGCPQNRALPRIPRASSAASNTPRTNHATVREQLRRVATHNYLVEDK